MADSTFNKWYSTDKDETTKSAVIDLENRCRSILLDCPEIPAKERRALEGVIEDFRTSFETLAWAIDSMRDVGAEDLLNIVYRKLFVFMRATTAMGGANVFTEATRELYLRPVRDQKRQAGKMSGDQRRANRYWVKHATDLAKQLAPEGHNLSQDVLATQIEDSWKDRKVAPSHATLKKHVSTLIAGGVIPSRTQKARAPKKVR